MTPISNITGLSAEIAELLGAAGIRSAPQLAQEDSSRLHARIELLAWQRGKATITPVSYTHLTLPTSDLV